MGTATDEVVGVPGSGQPLTRLDVNVDDPTGETLAHAVAECLSPGGPRRLGYPHCHEEGSTGSVVSALCDPAAVATVAGVPDR
ncbi:MAG: hypothetical protein Ct9H300mP31_03860 [Acidimicrobiaceae bacterium]|nr:MAG: hypothetical protein Ct9H300mP31_03860 [Acidimicrobiaceae bacterium]